jgi:flagellar biosynthesis/type III secretory pathway chaperone
MTEFSLRRVHSSQENLLERLDRANQTIRTLEHRVAMQERTYMSAMQEKNQKIRELQLTLQNKP